MKTLTIDELGQALNGKDVRELHKKFAIQQPHLTLALVQEYGYLPKTAVLLYSGLVANEGDAALPTVSSEISQKLIGQIKADRDTAEKELIQEQEPIQQMLKKGYGYVPLPAMLVYLGLKKQLQLASDELEKIFNL